MGILTKTLLFTVFAGSCWAKVDLQSTQPLVIPVDNVTPVITNADVAEVIPLDLKEDDQESLVLSRIADRGFAVWYKSSIANGTSFAQFAEKTSEKFKADVVVSPSSAIGPGHKFSFKVEPLQAVAKMEYSGWMRAAFNYNAKDAATDLSFKEKVLANKDLILSTKTNRVQTFSMIGLGWSW